MPASLEIQTLSGWMKKAGRRLKSIRKDSGPESIHGLRTALRRCLCLSEALYELTHKRVFLEIQGQAEGLFKKLGKLRNAQVMIGWQRKLSHETSGGTIRRGLEPRQEKARRKAHKALHDFELRRWEKTRCRLAKKGARNKISQAALDRKLRQFVKDLKAVRKKALKARTVHAYHKLRNAYKDMRYLLENVFDGKYPRLEKRAKTAQDVLGAYHDLMILLRFIEEHGKLTSKEAALKRRIRREAAHRLALYQRQPPLM